jgi:signal transduction histidine kinase
LARTLFACGRFLHVMNEAATSLAAPFTDAGTSWFRRTEAAERLPLITGVVSRFNHDLRTPLNTIAGWTHLLQASAADATRTRHVAEVFSRNVREETLMLEEFVDDARVLLGVLALDMSEIDATELLADASERLAPALDVHEVRLLPQLDCEGEALDVDRPRATRLVYRLLMTAVRRAPEGAAVTLRARAAAECVEIDIEALANRATFENGLLLDLRIASAVTHLSRGTLDIGAPDSSRFLLRLPLQH